MDAVPVKEITSDKCGETSASVRKRVEAARKIQLKRYEHAGILCNAQMTNRHIEEMGGLSEDARGLLIRAVEKYSLSMRGYTRMIKVARTISDLNGDEMIQPSAMAEAIQYRMLDSKYWER